MKNILFVMSGLGYLRHYGPAIRLLAQRGHQVHVAFDPEDEDTSGLGLRDTLERECALVSFGPTPELRKDEWSSLATAVRFFMDYLRYLHPKFRDASVLRERMMAKVPTAFLRFYQFVQCRCGLSVLRLMKLLNWVERCIPINPVLINWLTEQKPDALLITPLVYFGSDQVDYVKAAKKLGIKSGFCVASWDNLTNKGLIRVVPDKVFLWNSVQKSEAVEMHGVRPDQVVMTGAQLFDDWFEAKPTLPYADFCQNVGLDPAKPFFLYLCSSKFIAPNESKFVERWIRRLRDSSDTRLNQTGVLIRPHPKNVEQWKRDDLAHFGNVVVWPRGGEVSVNDTAKAGFFNSLYYCAAVVGINTSALIEAGIVGRPVHTVVVPEFEKTQRGTLHFHYLVEAGDGLLNVATDFNEHFRQLSAELSDLKRKETSRKGQKFILAFVRPFGLEKAATPLLADGIEALADAESRPKERLSFTAILGRVLFYPFAFSCQFARLNRKKRTIGIVGMFLPDPSAKFFHSIIRLYCRIKIGFLTSGVMIGLWRKKNSLKENGGIRRLFVGLIFGLMPSLPNRRGAASRLVQWVLPAYFHKRLLLWLFVKKVRNSIRSKVQSKCSIVAGPWTGDIWTELFLWIPFLNWMKKRYSIPSERFYVISRGDAAMWYQGISENYVDLTACFTPAELEDRTRDRLAYEGQWPEAKTDLDRKIISRIKTRLNSGELALVHPGILFKLVSRHLASNGRPTNWLKDLTDYSGLFLTNGHFSDIVLPKEYVVVKACFNENLKDTPEARQHITQLVCALLDATDVVLLDALPGVDRSHLDFNDHIRLHRVKSGSLTLQTRVISGAKASVGPYGGFSYVAALSRVKSVGLYTILDRKWTYRHRLAETLCRDHGFQSVQLMPASNHKDVLETLGFRADSLATLLR